ncbi:MAG TPA: acyl-CoA dehydrogenase family protein [Acidimicrobiia bacterium]|nr:acyl-CoA dehydrogenase family protein [Acidimicrobiia bacterium]
MEAAERALLQASVRDAIEGSSSTSADDVLARLGWPEMLEAEPRDAVDVVFTTLGATNAAATVLDDVIVSALHLEPRPELAVLLPPFASWDPPGRLDGGTAHAVGLGTARAAGATDLVVACRDGAVLRRVIVPMSAVEVTPVRGIDPGAGLHFVRFDQVAADVVEVQTEVWDATVAAGRRAVAHQLDGACRTMLALARTHAMERMQFGRPIARFQAVRHRLADALVAVEALEATLAAAWDEACPTTGALAKASAGRAARTVATHCQQVLAGVGFTTDHPFHRFLKRALALEGLFGSADDIVAEIGRQLMAERTVPTLVDL